MIDADLGIDHDVFVRSGFVGGHLPRFGLQLEYLYFLLHETVHRAYVSHVREVVPFEWQFSHPQNFSGIAAGGMVASPGDATALVVRLDVVHDIVVGEAMVVVCVFG